MGHLNTEQNLYYKRFTWKHCRCIDIIFEAFISLVNTEMGNVSSRMKKRQTVDIPNTDTLDSVPEKVRNEWEKYVENLLNELEENESKIKRLQVDSGSY